MSDCFVPFRLCSIDLPRDILWWLWVLEIKMRFVEGLRARQHAAIVIQQAWFEHVHGPLPGLIEADGHVWPSRVWPAAINPMILGVFGNVEHFDDMEEVD